MIIKNLLEFYKRTITNLKKKEPNLNIGLNNNQCYINKNHHKDIKV